MEENVFRIIKDSIKDVGQSFDVFKETNNEKLTELKTENSALRERIEVLESGRNTPGKTALPGAGRHKEPTDFRVFHTNSGKIYQMPSTTKMVDVLPPEKPSEISLERWLGATVAGESCGDKLALEFAKEQKQMVTTTSGVLIPAQYVSQWVDLLRSAMVLNACGMVTVTMDAKTQIRSAVLTDPATSWHTEAGAITAGNPTFAARTLTSTTLVSRCQASVELAQDSPDFGAQLSAVMSAAIAARMDSAGMIGSGTPPEPRGILNTVGIGSVSGGAISDFTKLLAGVAALLNANVPLDVATRNIIMNPYVWSKLEGLVTGISGDKTQLARPAALANTNFRVTTGVGQGSPIAESVLMGDFSNLILGIRRDPSIEILKLDTYSGNLLLEFIGYTRLDYVVVRPSAFVKVVGLT